MGTWYHDYVKRISWVPADDATLTEIIQNGGTLSAAAAALGLSKSCVGRRMRALGLMANQRRVKWSKDDELRLRQLWDSGAPRSVIVKSFPERSPMCVRAKIRNSCFDHRDWFPWTPEELKTLNSLWEQEASTRAISDALVGRSWVGIQLKASELGLSRFRVKRKYREQSECLQLEVRDAAWLAGMIDGEGTISIYHMSQSKNFHARIGVVNTYKAAMEYIGEITGFGFLTAKESPNRGHKICYSWQTNSSAIVYTLLKQVRPYLKIKHEQADLVMEYLEEWMAGRRNSIPQCAERVYQELKALNARGRVAA